MMLTAYLIVAFRSVSRMAVVISFMLASLQLLGQGKELPMEHPAFYKTTQIDGLSIFYREAGPKDAPTILLLHGLPSSSRMFEPLFVRLSERYHLIAPDYPGYGHSDWPDPKKFAYTFDHIAEIMNHFTEALGLSRYTLYMQDYGGPVGFRMALVHPERIEALIVQDAVAHNEGLGANWKTRRAFWADREPNESALRTNLLSLATTRTRHVGDDPNVERYDPDLWTDEFYFLNQPGQADIQSDVAVSLGDREEIARFACSLWLQLRRCSECRCDARMRACIPDNCRSSHSVSVRVRR